MSASLVVALSVLAAAPATLTLNLLARLEWRRARAWTRPASQDAPVEPVELPEARQGACGCLTVADAVALLHEPGLPAGRPARQRREAAGQRRGGRAIWPAPPDRIAAVQFGTPPTLGPAHQQPTSHLDATALVAASRHHRATLISRPEPDAATQPEVFELVYPLGDSAPTQHSCGALAGRPPQQATLVPSSRPACTSGRHAGPVPSAERGG